jgi:hypothetical protein
MNAPAEQKSNEPNFEIEHYYETMPPVANDQPPTTDRKRQERATQLRNALRRANTTTR